VGYEEGGYLTEAVRRKPYSVLLLDEVEKAHPDVFNVLLQVLDDGRLTDGQGRTVDFKNTVIVMTSNIGSHADPGMVGEDAEDIKEAVWGNLKPFPTRIPEPHRRNRGLPRTGCQEHRGHCRSSCACWKAVWKRWSCKCRCRAGLAELAKVGFDPVFGARPLKRAIQQRIENPLSKLLLEGKFPPKSVIEVAVDPVQAPGVFQFTQAVPMGS
jgi:ATP-dependent Clp protease ATP-binding subunit ClpB